MLVFHEAIIQPCHEICSNNYTTVQCILLDDVTAILDEHDHTEIFQTTESASAEWRAIGRKLGFTVSEMDSIVREPGRNGDVDYYEAMLKRWLDWAPPSHTPPSLQSLQSALRAAGKERQANDLATKYKVRRCTVLIVLLLHAEVPFLYCDLFASLFLPALGHSFHT